MDFYSDYPERLLTQLGPTKIIQTHGHLTDINFNFKNWFLGPKMLTSVSMSLACAKCLDGRKGPLPRSRFYQSILEPSENVSLSVGDDSYFKVDGLWHVLMRFYPGLSKELLIAKNLNSFCWSKRGFLTPAEELAIIIDTHNARSCNSPP